MRNIWKTFPVNNAHALSGADFVIERGKIHGLLGENAAGKSTMMKILCGLHKADRGEIFFNGEPVRFKNPREAFDHGIGMVYQHFRLIDQFTVLENIILGSETEGLKLIRRAEQKKRIKALLDEYGFDIDLDKRVGRLSIGEKQLVEIIRILFRNADILIMDEPTAVLSDFEKEKLFNIMRKLKKAGKSMVLITHNLTETFEMCDDIRVFRHGKTVYHAERGHFSKDDILKHMLDFDLPEFIIEPYQGEKKVILQVKNLTLIHGGRTRLKDVTMRIRSGDVTGIASLAGNGAMKLLETIFDPCGDYGGQILFKGQEIGHVSVDEKREMGIAYVPEDGLYQASALTLPLMVNLLANRFTTGEYSRHHLLKRDRMNKKAKAMLVAYDIHADSIEQPIGMLSGGNIQKSIIAREVDTKPELFMINEPTRGLDSGAVHFTYEILEELRGSGTGIIVVSSDVDGLMDICDEIYVMFRGEFVYRADREDFDKKTLNEYLAGMNKGAVRG
ncbi:MAG TPA: ABC transporter ATP-binding protein [Thermotogota bacterium]|nr:ABC transporter ATP-binding protein [Thermotogota bacterium]HPJ89230.1 ABC transporter ATP-binding protein [Thermotogota bacterium]HPR95860.1 ABC transporter ATP-binding protein [Thermotogota bacterium]